jgi:hypothetical protein
MTIYKITKTGDKRIPYELENGTHSIQHKSVNSSPFDDEVELVFSINKDMINLHIDQCKGDLSRIIVGNISDLSYKYDINAKDLLDRGVTDITLNPTVSKRLLVQLYDANGFTLESWPNTESARVGHLSKER